MKVKLIWIKQNDLVKFTNSKAESYSLIQSRKYFYKLKFKEFVIMNFLFSKVEINWKILKTLSPLGQKIKETRFSIL